MARRPNRIHGLTYILPRRDRNTSKPVPDRTRSYYYLSSSRPSAQRNESSMSVRRVYTISPRACRASVRSLRGARERGGVHLNPCTVSPGPRIGDRSPLTERLVPSAPAAATPLVREDTLRRDTSHRRAPTAMRFEVLRNRAVASAVRRTRTACSGQSCPLERSAQQRPSVVSVAQQSAQQRSSVTVAAAGAERPGA